MSWKDNPAWQGFDSAQHLEIDLFLPYVEKFIQESKNPDAELKEILSAIENGERKFDTKYWKSDRQYGLYLRLLGIPFNKMQEKGFMAEDFSQELDPAVHESER